MSSVASNNDRSSHPAAPPRTITNKTSNKALRRNSACLPCRTRKRRCDGERPACSRCERLGEGERCSYAASGSHHLPRQSSNKILRPSRSRNLSPAPINRNESVDYAGLDQLTTAAQTLAEDETMRMSTPPLSSGSPMPPPSIHLYPPTSLPAPGSLHPQLPSITPTSSIRSLPPLDAPPLPTSSPTDPYANQHVDSRPPQQVSNGHHSYNNNHNGYHTSRSHDHDTFTPNFFQNSFVFQGAEEFTQEEDSLPDYNSAGNWRGMGRSNSTSPPMEHAQYLPLRGDLALDMADQFFDRCHPLLPCINKRDFMDELEDPKCREDPNILMLAVLAVACMEQDDREIRDVAPILYNRAKQKFNFACAEGNYSVRAVQAACWMAMYLFINAKMAELWILLGSAYRMASPLGLHRIDWKKDTHSGAGPLAKTEREKEYRRRVMWSLFTLDRYFSFSCGWPFAIDDRFFCVYAPANDEVYQNPSVEHFDHTSGDLFSDLSELSFRSNPQLGHIHYICELCVFLGRIANFHNKPDPLSHLHEDELSQLQGKLARLRLQIPTRLTRLSGQNLTIDTLAVQLELLYHLCTVLLYYPTSSSNTSRSVPSALSDPTEPSPHGIEENLSLTAIKEIMTLMKKAVAMHQDILVNPLNLPIYFLCARILIQRWNEGGRRQKQIRDDIDLIHLTLERASQKWPRLAEKYTGLIMSDLRRTERMAERAAERGDGSTIGIGGMGGGLRQQPSMGYLVAETSRFTGRAVTEERDVMMAD